MFVPIRILADHVAMGPGLEVGSGETYGYALISETALPKTAKTQKRTAVRLLPW